MCPGSYSFDTTFTCECSVRSKFGAFRGLHLVAATGLLQNGGKRYINRSKSSWLKSRAKEQGPGRVPLKLSLIKAAPFSPLLCHQRAVYHDTT